MAQGRPDPDITAELFLSRNTAQTYVSHTLAELGARSCTEIVAEALRISRRPCPVRRQKQPDGHAEVSLPQGSADATDPGAEASLGTWRYSVLAAAGSVPAALTLIMQLRWWNRR